jgi:hypothetical protein
MLVPLAGAALVRQQWATRSMNRTYLVCHWRRNWVHRTLHALPGGHMTTSRCCYKSLLLFVRLPDSSSATIILHLGNTSLLAFFPITNDGSNTGKLSDKKGLSPIERSTIHTLSSLNTFSMPLNAQQHFSGGTEWMLRASFFMRLTRCQAIQRLQKPWGALRVRATKRMHLTLAARQPGNSDVHFFSGSANLTLVNLASRHA